MRTVPKGDPLDGKRGFKNRKGVNVNIQKKLISISAIQNVTPKNDRSGPFEQPIRAHVGIRLSLAYTGVKG